MQILLNISSTLNTIYSRRIYKQHTKILGWCVQQILHFLRIKRPGPLRILYCLKKLGEDFSVDWGCLLTKDLGKDVRFGAADTEGYCSLHSEGKAEPSFLVPMLLGTQSVCPPNRGASYLTPLDSCYKLPSCQVSSPLHQIIFLLLEYILSYLPGLGHKKCL